ncbi:hypothetical protein [Terricaulis sp.]|uniref:hypothetical protein n=1 Tax=Terricaulis sp. TaxID=2768686 RepID=UPI002AC4EE01|nr:hypothetical protein [Terricaulis sp.]MDZ4689693.1 hypothetical protein [Terricaulis sp.]
MLETLRKSTKKFSSAEFMQFVEDMKSATADELGSILNPPKVTRSATKGKAPADPFVKRLNALKKDSGMKAADAVGVLKDFLRDHPPSMKVPAKTMGSFPALLKVVREAVSDDEVEAAFREAASEFKAKFSVRYDLT